MIFLPVGRPELCVIETIWHMLKSELIHGKYYKDVDELEKKIELFFKQTFDLDVMSYLQRQVVDNN